LENDPLDRKQNFGLDDRRAVIEHHDTLLDDDAMNVLMLDAARRLDRCGTGYQGGRRDLGVRRGRLRCWSDGRIGIVEIWRRRLIVAKPFNPTGVK
jgi:hypothetical protein